MHFPSQPNVKPCCAFGVLNTTVVRLWVVSSYCHIMIYAYRRRRHRIEPSQAPACHMKEKTKN
ncbi:hypothetical protein BC936DRAFT_140180 [Jimgerdemannia flammicorona]|uniref:Uncharacterized protein n=1 Tax=Jimgerdemannia flammicorona TaxID=994334 RepID=A0A433AXQ3_9FUNG|nr:hypothetical protein BC936DRAFT_140180 [Jimgerdemannia flammicorona]